MHRSIKKREPEELKGLQESSAVGMALKFIIEGH